MTDQWRHNGQYWSAPHVLDDYSRIHGLTTGSPSNPDRPDYSRSSPAVITNSVSYRACNNHPILGDQDIST